MTNITLVFVICLVLHTISLINGQCLTPLTAYGNSTIAPPVLDSSATGFITNPASTNVNNTRLLAIKISWATVQNRVLTWAGIGSESAAAGGCTAFVAAVPPAFTANGGWYLNASTPNCFDELTANYSWPESLYAPSCAPLFTIDNTDPLFSKISFDLIVKFNETYTITRGGNTYFQVKTISSKLPLTLSFPKTVTVDSTAVRVYSAASIDISADLIGQDITNSPPFQITFLTLNGRSFALDQPISTYAGQYDPLSDVVTFQSEVILGTTRQTTWKMAIVPRSSACVLTGQYNITYNLYWTAVDANGNPLAANQNPLPNNATVTITFDIQSQSFCATTVSSSLAPTLNIFDAPPSPTTYYTGVSERLGFFTNSRVYFRAQVSSDNLPLRSVRLTNFFLTAGSNRTDLVVNGIQSISSAPNIDYQQSLSLVSQPPDQALFNIRLSPDVFQVLQDKDTQYVFNALLTVQYSTTGGKKRKLISMSFSPKDLMKQKSTITNNGVQVRATTATTSIAATAKMTLQQTAVSPTTAPNIINTSSANKLMASCILSIFSLFFLVW